MARRIWVQVKPHAKQETLILLGEDSYQASVHAPPQEGKANQAVIELLARHFSRPKSAIEIVRGHSSRKKLIEIR